MAPMKPSRRAARAAILAALIFLVGDVLVGFGTAEEAVEPEVLPPPEEFGTPAPAVGDLVEYETSVSWTSDGSGPGVQGSASWSHEWLGQREMLDAEGAPRWARAVAYQGLPQDARMWVDAATGERIGFDYATNQSDQSEDPFLPVGPLNLEYTDNGSSAANVYWPSLEWYHAHPLGCGIHHALQGQVISIDAPIELLPAPCDILGASIYLDARQPPLFSAIRQEMVGEQSRVVFEATNVTLWVGPAEVRIWLQDDLPYPVRMEFQYREGERLVVTELVRWRAGNEPFETGPATLEPAPPLEFAPVKSWGLDDKGIEHPFPLSEAYKRALQDEQYEGLRDFMADHPDAATVRADYDEFVSDNEIHRRWMIHVADELEFLVFESTQSVRPILGSAVPAIIEDLPDAPIVYEAKESDRDGYVIETPRQPSSLPTASSLLARAEAFHESVNVTEPLNGYGFTIPQASDETVQYRAGVDRIWLTRFPEGAVPFHSYDAQRNHTATEFAADGRALWMVQQSSTEERRVDPGASPSSTDAPARADPTPLGHSVKTVSTWGVPSPRVLASMGLAALGVGGLYYLWPNLKGLAIGLFSRLRTNDAFTHLQRAGIQDALGAEPGLHAVELARRLGASRGSVEHHLAQLAQAGLVTSVASGRYRCYFLAGSVDRRVMNATPVLKADGARSLLNAIRDAPGTSLTELARTTGLSAATVNHHAGRLEKAGLVQRQRSGRSVAHFATDLGSEMSEDAS